MNKLIGRYTTLRIPVLLTQVGTSTDMKFDWNCDENNVCLMLVLVRHIKI